MHLIERYSVACGAKIGEPFILTRFFPIAPEKFITFHPSSKYDSKVYDYWQDVLDIIHPKLQERNISIIQIGSKGDRAYNYCYNTAGQTSVNQAAFIISHAIMHVGSDSFAAHVASGFRKKIVALYSNNFMECVRPYWGDMEKDMRLISSPKNGKPNFSQVENPKTINDIRPEVIAKEILSLLGINFDFPFETKRVGAYTKNVFIESAATNVVDERAFNSDSMVVRMDFNFNEAILDKQLQKCPCSIVSDMPVSLDMLKEYRGRVREFIYDLTENYNMEFLSKLLELGIPVITATGESGELLNKIKLDLLDFGQIHIKKIPNQEEIDKVKSWGKLWYKTTKFTISEGKFYPSKAALVHNKPCQSIRDSIHEVIDCPEFWEELENVKILTKS